MHSLVPFLTAMGRYKSRLFVESMEVSPDYVCKGGSDLTVISFPGLSWILGPISILEWPFPLSTP